MYLLGSPIARLESTKVGYATPDDLPKSPTLSPRIKVGPRTLVPMPELGSIEARPKAPVPMPVPDAVVLGPGSTKVKRKALVLRSLKLKLRS